MSRSPLWLFSAALLTSLIACKGDADAPVDKQDAASPEPAVRETEAPPEAAEPKDPEPKDSEPALRAEARELSARFGKTLKSKLVAALQHEDGAVHALETCQIEAPAVAKALSEGGWTASRTAQRVRNPDNAATDWQREGLDTLAKQLAAGPPAEGKAHEWSEIVTHEGGREFRYMQAIPMGGLCLGCHGSADIIAEPVRAQIAKLYPEDQATDFKVGELRGAFVFRKSL